MTPAQRTPFPTDEWMDGVVSRRGARSEILMVNQISFVLSSPKARELLLLGRIVNGVHCQDGWLHCMKTVLNGGFQQWFCVSLGGRLQ